MSVCRICLFFIFFQQKSILGTNVNPHLRIHFLVFFSFVIHQIFKFDRMPKFEDVEDDPAKINAVVGKLMIILCEPMFVNFNCCQNPYGCLRKKNP